MALTLEANSTKPFYINTDGKCFLCLKGELLTDNSIPNDGIYILRDICQYLEINMGKIIGSVQLEDCPFLENLKFYDENDWGDFSVLLCPNCLSCAKQFSKSYLNLQAAQMRMTSSVMDFTSKISSSKFEGVVEVECLHLVDEKPVLLKIAEELRLVTQEKCLLELEKVKQLQVQLDTEEVDEHSLELENGHQQSAMQLDNVNLQDLTPLTPAKTKKRVTFQDVPTFHDSPPPPVDQYAIRQNAGNTLDVNPNNRKAVKTRLKRKLVPRVSTVVHGLSCPFCDKTIKTGFLLRQHTTLKHPEELVEQHKRSDISHKRFQELCKSLLKTESKYRLSQNDKFACQYCPKRYKFRSHLKVHLLDILNDCYEKFSKHLIKIQQPKLPELKSTLQNCGSQHLKCTDDSSWQVILDKLCIDAKKVEEDDDDDTIFQCTLCSDHITFPDLSHLHFHMFHHHSEEFFQSAKQPHLSNEQFQKFCTTLFEAHTKMARDMSALQRQVDWDDKANAGALSSCPFGCSDFLFDNENFLTVHLIKVHHKNVREKLRDLQREHAVT